jgi:hypothetical protein
MHPEGPATGHLDTGFLGFPLSLSKCWDKIIRNSNFRFLLETTPYYRNIFTFTLFLPEGRVGVAWEPSNKILLFLPPRKIKCFSLHPLISSLNLLFNLSFISLSLSLGFGFKGLIRIMFQSVLRSPFLREKLLRISSVSSHAIQCVYADSEQSFGVNSTQNNT